MNRKPTVIKVSTDTDTYNIYISPEGCINLSRDEDGEDVLHVCDIDTWNKLDEAIRDHLQ